MHGEFFWHVCARMYLRVSICASVLLVYLPAALVAESAAARGTAACLAAESGAP